MTPEYHYAEAERLLAIVDVNGTDPRDAAVLAAAQVHANLAGAGLDRAEAEKLRAENARLNKVLDEKIASLNEVGEWESCAQETLDRIEKVLDEGAAMSEYWQVTEIEQIVALWNAKMDKK